MLRIPRDPQVLQLLKKSMNRYQVSRHFGDQYGSVRAYLKRLERMGLIKVVREDKTKGKGAIKFYRTTKKGEQALGNLEGLASLELNKE